MKRGGRRSQGPDPAERLAGLRSGGVLRLEPGEYRVGLVIDRPVTVVGTGKTTVLLGRTGAGPILDIRSAGVVLEGLWLEHLDPRGEAIRARPGDAPTVRNVIVHSGAIENVPGLAPRAASGESLPAVSSRPRDSVRGGRTKPDEPQRARDVRRRSSARGLGSAADRARPDPVPDVPPVKTTVVAAVEPSLLAETPRPPRHFWQDHGACPSTSGRLRSAAVAGVLAPRSAAAAGLLAVWPAGWVNPFARENGL